VIRKKVSMLGAFAVGKTSLVHRFVSGIFSERYVTTVGVRIDKKELVLDGRKVDLILWDLHGEDEFQRIRSSYLRGSAGYLLVVDGTRRDTLDVALELHDTTRKLLGDVPFSILVNKRDLDAQWELAEADLEGLRARGWHVVATSAKTGDEVESAFEDLARRLVRA
jgi:hypothetical protein